MKTHIFMFMALLSTLTFAQKTITMTIKENTVPCQGVAPMNCMQVKEGKAKEWTYFYDAIEGFQYEPGYQYKLKVVRNKRGKDIPADASAYTYRLKKIVYKKKVETKAPLYLNKKMILTRINGQTVTGGKVYLTIDPAENKIFGKSGCNRFNSNYKLNGNKIEIALLLGTMMACDQESMTLEQNFKTVMDQKTFEIYTQENTVQFIDPKTKKATLAFTIPTESDIWSFIEGKKWKLIQLDHVSKDYGKAAISFDIKNKKVKGNSGCNNFFGTYTIKGEEISFSPLGGTKMMCIDKEAGAAENKILQHLSNATLRYDVAEQTLNFYKDDKLIMMFAVLK